MDREDAELAVRFLEATKNDPLTDTLRSQRQNAGAVMWCYSVQIVTAFNDRVQAVAAAQAIAREGQSPS